MSKAPESRRERKKRETRFKILDTALGLFAKHGYDNVRIGDIRKIVDVANATFFAYFPTKSALIAGFSDELVEQVISRMQDYDISPIEKLEVLRAFYLDEWLEHRELMQKIFKDPESPEGIAVIASGLRLITFMADIIAQAQQDAEIDPSLEPTLIAHCIMGGWRATMITYVADGDKDKAIEQNRQVMDIVLSGATPR